VDDKAGERIEEAVATGAEAIVTTCPWCVSAFMETIEETRALIEVYELTELVVAAVERRSSK